MKTSVQMSRPIVPGIVLSILFIGFSLSGTAQSMSGNYVIKQGVSDFDNDTIGSFNEAVDSLVSRGVDGAVIIDVMPGTYDERITIPSITGASEANTITFQSETGDSNDVIMQPSSFETDETNHIVYFVGAGYITFQNMTFDATLSTSSYRARIIYLDNEANDLNLGSHHIALKNNLFYGKEVWDYSNERGLIIGSWGEGVHDILIDNEFILFAKTPPGPGHYENGNCIGRDADYFIQIDSSGVIKSPESSLQIFGL